ncbi:128L [Invertebrate iridescent virus Kaz2018]|uniref:128L n=1 Tax=Invertebrate iridescent virus 6 TaxID=176652 RepID=Q91G09_IIV6|nr:128L [Invertebrate iridescent virus 6]AAK82023.1 128L [Invertebrate iridescent virus 6]QMS79319.1 hypothetical protein IIV6-T1_132 [Invertebrate iridescent virus 6]QNH08538.1 128L [Invertebrate iridescent virus Kaz2018]
MLKVNIYLFMGILPFLCYHLTLRLYKFYKISNNLFHKQLLVNIILHYLIQLII